jgi:protease-4
MSPEELALMQLEVDDVYTQFLERVSKGRKLSKGGVQKVARGRVWTGSDAKRRKLIDALGGLKSSISALSEKVGVKEVVYYPQKEDNAFNDFIALVDEELENDNSRVKNQIPSEFLAYYQKYDQIKKMKGIQMRLPFTFYFY